MNCQECRSLVERFLDHALTGFARRKVNLHLSRCADCRAYFDRRRENQALAYRALNNALANTHLPEGFSERFRAARVVPERRLWPFRHRSRWKAAALLALLLGGVAFAAWRAAEWIKETAETEGTEDASALASSETLSSVPSTPSTETITIQQGENAMNITETTATVARATAKAVAVAALALGSSIPAEADPPPESVFSDAAIWLKGAYDRNGTVGMDGNDLRNAFSAARTISTVSVWGEATNCVRRYENVPCPYANTVLSNVPCFYMPQCVGEDGKFNPRHFLISNVTSINCRASIVARIRPEMPVNGSYCWLMGGPGLLVGFIVDSGKLRLRGFCGNWQTSDFTVEPGTWMDIAVVPDMDRLQFYAVTNNGTLWKGGARAAATGFNNATNTTIAFGLYQSGYSSWSAVATNSSSARTSAFRGTIQSFAVWNRLLSDAEIREAFAYPRTDIMRIGMANGTGGEFVKASPDGAKVNPDDWYTMPSALAPGEAVDIDFSLKDHEATLPQVLRLTSLAGSAGGLDVSVNGTAVKKTLMSMPGATKSLFLPGDIFRAGVNTMHLANTSPGTVYVDALALGGSWQVGHANNSNAEFGNKYKDVDVCDGSWPELKTTDTNTQNTVTVNIPAELAACGHPARFTVRGYMAYGVRWYDPKPICELAVNGVCKGQVTFTEQYQTFTAKLEPGELKAGTNVFAFINRSAPWTAGDTNKKYPYINMDFWRLEIKKIPPGMVISFR